MSALQFLPIDAMHEVSDYPYGFSARTSARFYVERKPGKGMRSVSQTLNPKTGAWNKPKASTYSAFVRMYVDENGHAKFFHYTPYSYEDYLKAVSVGLFDGIDSSIYPHEATARSMLIQGIKWRLSFRGFVVDGNEDALFSAPTLADAWTSVEEIKSASLERLHAISEALKAISDVRHAEAKKNNPSFF